jgi:hypothetical protein
MSWQAWKHAAELAPLGTTIVAVLSGFPVVILRAPVPG